MRNNIIISHIRLPQHCIPESNERESGTLLQNRTLRDIQRSLPPRRKEPVDSLDTRYGYFKEVSEKSLMRIL